MKRSGTIRTCPLLTASIAGAASGAIRTNHWVLISGCTIVPQRSQCPTAWVCGSTETS